MSRGQLTNSISLIKKLSITQSKDSSSNACQWSQYEVISIQLTSSYLTSPNYTITADKKMHLVNQGTQDNHIHVRNAKESSCSCESSCDEWQRDKNSCH